MFCRWTFPQSDFECIGLDLEFDDFCSQLNFLKFNHDCIVIFQELIGLTHKILDISVNTMFKPSHLGIKLIILIHFCDIESFLKIISKILIFMCAGMFLFAHFLALLNAVIVYNVVEMDVLMWGFVVLVDGNLMLFLDERFFLWNNVSLCMFSLEICVVGLL